MDGGEEQADSGTVATGEDSTAGMETDIEQLLLGSIRGNLSFVGGILGGGISYVAGLIGVTIMFGTLAESESLSLDPEAVEDVGGGTGEALAEAMIGGNPESPQTAVSILGWVFYNAHGVAINVVSEDSINFLALTEMGLVPFALIPAGLLFTFGGLVALLKRADGLLGGFISGASVLIGYLPLVIAGAMFFTVSGGGETATVALLPAILLAGIIFPLFFGGLAGLVKVLVINVAIGGLRNQLSGG